MYAKGMITVTYLQVREYETRGMYARRVITATYQQVREYEASTQKNKYYIRPRSTCYIITTFNKTFVCLYDTMHESNIHDLI